MSKQPSDPAKPGKTEEQLHYESLITLFKYVAGIAAGFIAFLSTLGGIFLYGSAKDIEARVKETEDKTMARIEKMEKGLDDEKIRLSAEYAELRNRSERAVQVFREDAQAQIGAIGSSSSAIARREAVDRINSVFESRNLDKVISDVAQSRIEPKVKQIVDGNLSSISASIKDQTIEYQFVTRFQEVNGGMQFNWLAMKVDSLYRTSKYEYIREEAKKSLSLADKFLNPTPTKPETLIEWLGHSNPKIFVNGEGLRLDADYLISAVMDKGAFTQDIVLLFQVATYITGVKFRPFDYDGLRKAMTKYKYNIK